MLELADIFRRHGADYRAQHQLLPSQLRAMLDIERCRTVFFGGHLKQCEHCGRQLYAYHSCRNRHCPKCHADQTQRWLAQQHTRLLPGPYFLLTFTLPQELRPLAFAHQRKVYGLLMRSAADALKKLARDPRYLGGQLGVLAVLHTWTRAMLYHPHVHLLVTAGGLSLDGKAWLPARHANYLVPVQALSLIFRAKLCAALKRAGLLGNVSTAVWRKDWVVHCQPAGQGHEVLNYLARYIFRVALSNSRLESFDNGQVTFRYRDNRSQQLHRLKLPAEQFIHRFLQHTLPRGCAKLRYYGIYAPAARPQLQQARALLGTPTITGLVSSSALQQLTPVTATETARCPLCRQGYLRQLAVLPPQREPP